MKKLRFKFLSTYSVLLTSLLALLGFAQSCDPVMEYGTPSARFIVNGGVSSAKTEQPIPNIRVVMQHDTVFTDEYGKYSISDNYAFPMEQTFSIQFTDIDSVENEHLVSIDTIVEFVDPEFEGGDSHWYMGETEKVFNIKLDSEE